MFCFHRGYKFLNKSLDSPSCPTWKPGVSIVVSAWFIMVSKWTPGVQFCLYMDMQSLVLSLCGDLVSSLVSMWTPGVQSAFFYLSLDTWKSKTFTSVAAGVCYCLYVDTWETIIVSMRTQECITVSMKRPWGQLLSALALSFYHRNKERLCLNPPLCFKGGICELQPEFESQHITRVTESQLSPTQTG